MQHFERLHGLFFCLFTSLQNINTVGTCRLYEWISRSRPMILQPMLFCSPSHTSRSPNIFDTMVPADSSDRVLVATRRDCSLSKATRLSSSFHLSRIIHVLEVMVPANSTTIHSSQHTSSLSASAIRLYQLSPTHDFHKPSIHHGTCSNPTLEILQLSKTTPSIPDAHLFWHLTPHPVSPPYLLPSPRKTPLAAPVTNGFSAIYPSRRYYGNSYRT